MKKNLLSSIHYPLLYISIILPLTIKSMEIEKQPEDLECGKQTHQIHVTTMEESYALSITDNTTILDVKNRLQNLTGIPVEQQNLQARKYESWTQQLLSTGNLYNEDKIKSIIDMYNTYEFALLGDLRLQKKSQERCSQALQIHITSKEKSFDISITDKTTVLDVKNRLQDLTGIPTEQQNLQARKYESSKLLSTGNLYNTWKIKKIIDMCNTNEFASIS